MPSTPIADDARGYLQSSRAAVLQTLEGLSEYDIRRPMTPTGTNLLGVVKHLIGIEAGYLGVCVGRPYAGQLAILRELIDGTAGSDRDSFGDDWWREYVEHLEQVAREASQT